MAAKRYSAGAIFLQVVPVFQDVQKAIEDEAKNIDRALGDTMEKSGQKAGERAGKAASDAMNREVEKGTRDLSGSFEREFHKSVDGINKALGGINTQKLGNNLRREVAEMKKELASLKDVDLTVDADVRKADARLAELEGRLLAMRDNAKIVFRSDIDHALKGIAKIRAAREAISDPIDIEVRIDSRKIGAFEKEFKRTVDKAMGHLEGSTRKSVVKVREELARLQDLRIGVDIGAARARQELATLQAELRAIALDSPEIDVKLEAGRAYAEIATLDAALKKLDRGDIDIKVNTKGAERGLFGIARNGEDAANSFRSFNVVMLAVAGAGPALIPILGGIAAGLGAIAPAAVVAGFGLGSVLVGFTGLGDALTAYDAVQKQQAMNAQTAAKQNTSAGHAIEDAARGVADAERNAAQAAADAAQAVKDARQRAADGIEAALEQQRNAQEAYRESVEDVAAAEKALREARADAAGTGHDIKDRQKSNDLAIQQALLDSFAATNNYNAVMADGSSTNAEQEQARVSMEEAQQRLHLLRDEQKELAKEKKKWDKEGVNGTEQVQSAQEQLNQALEAQKDAYEAVRDAAQGVDEARADGARMVRDAIEQQNRTLADNARAVARAREQLARAKESQDELNASINSQANALDYAMSQLSPAGRRFARFLMGLKGDFRKFRNDIQQAMLPSIQSAMEGFFGSKSGSVVRKMMIDLAGGFGKFVKQLSKSFQGPVWLEFFRTMAKLGPDIQAAYGRAFIKLFEALASILTVLAPYALDFAKGVEKIATAFANWASSEKGQAQIQAFMDHMKEIGPEVIDAFVALALALGNLLVAMAPYSEMILSLLTDILEMIANMPTDGLGAFVGAILAVVTASQLAYSVMNLLLAGGALLRSSLGRLVFSFVGVGLAVYYVYQQNHALGIALGIVVGAIYGVIAVMKLWQLWQKVVWAFQVVKLNASMAIFIARTYAVAAAQKAVAVATRIWAAAQWVFNAAMSANPLGLILIAIVAVVAGMIWAYKHFEGFRKVVDTVIHAVADAFHWLWDFLFGHSVMPDIVDGMKWAADWIGKIFGWIGTAIRAIARVFLWLWENVVKPVAGFLWKAFKVAFGFIRAVWNNVLKPVLKVIGKVIWTLWKVYFKVALTLIKAYFKLVFMAIKFVWEHILKPVFNAVSKVLGWLWREVVKPILGWIGDKFGDVFRGMKIVWENVLKPVFNYIGDKALPKLKGAFETAVDGIKTIWDGLKKVVGAPIKFVLDTIINKGLIAGFNKVAGWVNMDGFDEIPIPKSLQSYATGGVMPGYTPGRDVHAFYSPTAGRLELSGGEAVMRPEWTQAVGPSFVNQMNAIARNKGVKGIRQAMGMGGYWMGGVLPFPGASVSSHGSMYGHPAYDLNYPGYSDYGQHVGAWKAGRVAQMNYIGDDSYGRWVILNHGADQSSLYAHLSAFAEGLKVGMNVGAGQWIGNVGDLGNTGTPPTSHLHFEIMGGNVDFSDTSTGGKSGGKSVPGFIKDLLLHPIDTIKGWATSTFDQASDFITGTPVWDTLKNVPGNLVAGFGDKAWDMMPGWAKSTVGVAGDFASAVKGGAEAVGGAIKGGVSAGLDAIGLAEGGILPYNGTMMYDNGGYLPPGLTSVVNLTGKPEPVFTHEQFAGMGGVGEAGTIHYEPHFEGSDLTAEDVAADVNFTFRRLKRGGKYAGVGQ